MAVDVHDLIGEHVDDDGVDDIVGVGGDHVQC